MVDSWPLQKRMFCKFINMFTVDSYLLAWLFLTLYHRCFDARSFIQHSFRKPVSWSPHLGTRDATVHETRLLSQRR